METQVEENGLGPEVAVDESRVVDVPQAPRLKVPLEWIPSDDCVVHVGQVIDMESDEPKIVEQGTPYHIHQGEEVGLLPASSLSQYVKLIRLIDVIQGIPTEQMGKSEGKALDLMIRKLGGDLEKALDGLCAALADHIGDWTWTDMQSYPLDKPYKNPEVIKALTTDEVLYLASLARGQNPEVRKNGSRPSADSSLEGGHKLSTEPLAISASPSTVPLT